MKRFCVLIIFFLVLPATTVAKTTDDCKGQGNRLFYARCVNKEATKRPLVRPMLHKMVETPCVGKTGGDFVGCMKVQERLRQIEHEEIDEACDNFKGMEKRLCEANGGPTGTGRVLTTPIDRVVPQWKSTRSKRKSARQSEPTDDRY